MITKDREYRSFEFEAKEEEKTIEGYAVVFDKETTLFEHGGVKYKEIIDRNAFDGVSLDDVVLNIDHTGKPLARTKNNTLELSIDDYGLKVRAKLDGTQAGREAHEEIKGGYFDKMSFSFTIEENSYNSETNTETILKIKRLYDVSVVTFPAYEQTSVLARNSLLAEAERKKAEAELVEKRRLEKQRLQLILNIKTKI